MINSSTVRDWVKLKRRTGSLAARRCGPKPQALDVWRERLTVLSEDNDATLAELIERLEARYSAETSKSALDRWFKKLATLAKKTFHAEER